MFYHPWIAVLLASGVLAGCSPAFNWREVRIEGGALVALLPCKPDKGERTLPLVGLSVRVHMQGCEVDGIMFTVATAQIPANGDSSTLLGAWRAALIANAGATEARDRSFIPVGARPLPASVQSLFTGRRADGASVVVQAAFFAQGDRVYQAAIFSNAPTDGVAETFFEGLGLR